MSQVDDRPVTRRSRLPGREDADEYAVLLPTRADTHPQAHERRRRIVDALLALTAPVAFFGVWQLASTNGWADPRYFPPPTEVWREAIEAPKIILIAVTVFFFMWIATMAAVMTIPATYHEAGRSLRASRVQALRHIVAPAVLPQVFVAMRVSAGVSILVLVGAEFVQGNDGIGYLIWHSWSLFVARRMYVGIVAVALLGYLFGEVVKLIGRVLTPWAPRDSQKVIA